MRSGRTKTKLVKITAWVPKTQMRRLMRHSKAKTNQSAILRGLIEDELERVSSLKAHSALYNIASKRDFDDRLL